MRAKITVYPRPEILDPQGAAVTAALRRLGFGEVTDVRVGKSLELVLDSTDADAARTRLEAMCEVLLVNRIVEDYSIEISPGEVSHSDISGESAGEA